MSPYYVSPTGDVTLFCGDALAVLRALPAGSVHTCLTSPPYWNLRSYLPNGHADKVAELGLEETPDAYVAALVAVFREVKRVLHPTGTCWINLGDGYGNERSWGGKSGAKNAGSDAGGYPRHKVGPGLGNKQLLMMPSRVAIALQADGWLLRSMIPYLKRSAMPESATDRPTTATEYVFLLSKAANYFYDADAVRVPQADFARGASGRRVALTDERPEPGVRNRTLNEIDRGGNRRAYHPAGRNRRNADWWFDSLRAILAGATGLLADEDGAPLALPVNPAAYPGAHFATFPPRLVEPMLLASTSARGCCPACGAPYTRIVEREAHSLPVAERTGRVGHNGTPPQQSGWFWKPAEVRDLGWRAGCACEAGDPIPAVVLDPFAGACTTGVVARKHGRHSWGIDLSATYLEMARERLGQLALPLIAGG